MTALADVRLTAAAFAAVASSPVMPDWQEYVRCVEASGARRAWAPTDARALRDAIGGTPPSPRGTVARTLAGLVSFADDHDAALPDEALPRHATLALIDALARHRGAPLAPAGQLALALRIDDDAWTALLACHLATRQLARGRDCRVLGPSAARDIGTRLTIGRAIAAFAPELAEGGDPLGDTYHYWANVCAGVLAVRRGGATGIAITRLFAAGPTLMTVVRQGLFGSPLFYGNHRRIDALGLRHGLELGATR